MDNYEKRIKEILDRPITVSAQFEYAIDTAFLNKAKKSNNVFNNFSLKFATTVVCLLLTFSTAVFAAYMIYENIWKDPERTSRKQREESVLAPIDEEELNNIISEEKAKTIATTIIENLGYENKTISEIKVNRSYENNEDLYYHIVFDNVIVQLDAKTGIFDYFEDKNTKVITRDNDILGKSSAIELANKVYKSVGIGNIEEYKVCSAMEKVFNEGATKNKYWEVVYISSIVDSDNYKDSFCITYKFIDGVVHVNSLAYRELDELVNNPIITTKDEAIKIALDKEKEFSSLDILKCEAELGIKKMNNFVFLLENKINNMNENIQLDNIERNVWIISIKQKKEMRPNNSDITTVREKFDKEFYIDATTGEIIGGKEIEYFIKKTNNK